MKTCEHLVAIEDELARRKITLSPVASPYDDDDRWFGCDCTFDGPALTRRLGLPDCVEYYEYDGRVAGSDATFRCRSCRRVILGLHPAYAPKRAPHVS